MKNKTDRILDNLEKIISVLFVSLLGMISYFFVNLEELTIIKLRLLIIGFAIVIGSIAMLCVVYVRYFNKE